MNRQLILVLALLNGILYCCVLPLWEGFDEPFHYAYVESISVDHRLLVLTRSRISREIRGSFDAVPLSRLLSEAMPGSLSFEEWSKLSETQKLARRARLTELTSAARSEPSKVVNYESQQTPLAYLIYAPFDWLLSTVSLPNRILVLRLLGTIAAAIFAFAALEQLADNVALTGAFRLVCLAVIFEGQMLWATMAHVGNDLLAVPLTIWFVTRLLMAARESTARNVFLVGCALAAGLLAKAYFLAFLPVTAIFLAGLLLSRRSSWQTVAAATAIVLLVDGPWYLRNVLLYGSLSGTQQSVAGIGVRQALAAVLHINWLKSAYEFSMWSLWTGNWSFLSFSKITIWLELLLILASLCAYLLFWRKITRPEVWLMAACASFACGLLYQTCVTWAHSNGISTHAEPWYGQGILAVLLVLGFRGLSQVGIAGRCIAIALSTISAWIAAMTYLVKLLPYYGSAVTRSNLRVMWSWWRSQPTLNLSTVVMVQPYIVYALLCVFLSLLGLVTVRLIGQLWTRVTAERS